MAANPNTARRVLLVTQHSNGVLNAFWAIYCFNAGVYWMALISSLCVLVTARWRIPPKKNAAENSTE